MTTTRSWLRPTASVMSCWLVLSFALSGCQSQPSVPPPFPKMPACLQAEIPRQSMLLSLTRAMAAFETGSSVTEPVPAMGAEEMRLCLLTTREAWPASD